MTFDPGKFHMVGEQEDDALKRGLDEQRAAYREASLRSDYDKMARALENMYCEIKPKLRQQHEASFEKITEDIDWFYSLDTIYRKKIPTGKYVVQFPPNLHKQIRERFRNAYLLINERLAALRLL